MQVRADEGMLVLKCGDRAPDFALPDQFGSETSLSELCRGGRLVLAFFPLAFSGQCTSELRDLRDHTAFFAEHNVTLAGVSVDSKFALRQWGERDGHGVTLLSDFWPHGAVARRYGVFVESNGFASRATFVIDGECVVRAAFSTELGEPRSFDQYEKALASTWQR